MSIKINRQTKSKANRAAHELALQFERQVSQKIIDALENSSDHECDDQVIDLVIADHSDLVTD